MTSKHLSRGIRVLDSTVIDLWLNEVSRKQFRTEDEVISQPDIPYKYFKVQSVQS
jgi:hypothetical protein